MSKKQGSLKREGNSRESKKNGRCSKEINCKKLKHALKRGKKKKKVCRKCLQGS